ncbi:MAG: glycosyltransferase [Crocinitomix sp.]|nr:glycosyltransferase [Crocinitomix sp.]
MNITIIIPTLNESQVLGRLLERLLTQENHKLEIIVVDGGSNDITLELAKSYGVKAIACESSRAKQMNEGAKIAQHDILYFVHADTLPPLEFYEDGKAYLEKGYDAVCYKSEFENGPFMLRLNQFFSQFYWLVSRGGDQSLFIRKSVFEALGRYNEEMVVMEEYPIIEKLMKTKKLAVINKPILISTRKYIGRSWLRVSRANYAAFKLYQKGADSEVIRARYAELLG